ncbi:MAG: hypothetical protein OXT09_00495, partial [Myxococcales bacterium]|nr:hypothetical protein [Myxococcales bacterium]
RIALPAPAPAPEPAAEPEPATEPEPLDEAQPEPDLSPRAAAEAAPRTLEAPAMVQAPAEAPEDDMLDLFIFDAFVGHSYMVMALGQTDLAAEQQALPEEGAMPDGEALDPTELSPSDLIDSVEGSGAMVGGSASVRLAMFSLGSRVTYSDYSDAEVLTLMGEAAVRMGGRPIEVSLSLGLGGGWLYGVPQALIEQDSGLAMGVGLDLNYRVHDHVAVGIGTDAVGLFLAGEGISPGQLGDFSTESDHPVGAQLPVHGTVSFLL